MSDAPTNTRTDHHFMKELSKVKGFSTVPLISINDSEDQMKAIENAKQLKLERDTIIPLCIKGVYTIIQARSDIESALYFDQCNDSSASRATRSRTMQSIYKCL